MIIDVLDEKVCVDFVVTLMYPLIVFMDPTVPILAGH
jgi:hypothetical protein